MADAVGGAFAVTLEPAARWVGRTLLVTRMNAGVNAVTITAAAGDTINGAATLVLSAQYTSAVLMGTDQNLWLRTS